MIVILENKRQINRRIKVIKNRKRKTKRSVVFALILLSVMGTVFLSEAKEKANKKNDNLALSKKLKSIIIPKIDLEEVTVKTAVRHLYEQSKRLDPKKKGVYIFLVKSEFDKIPVSLVGHNISLEKAISYICKAAGARYTVTQNSVIIKLNKRENNTSLKYGDGKADGKMSLCGSGEMIKFSLPTETGEIKGIRIHGSRYGGPRAYGITKAPDEYFLIYILSENLSDILYTTMAPYRLFKRGKEEWVKVTFKTAIEVPKVFWIVLDFRAHKTKGVYVSFDKSTRGVYSKMGLPGLKTMKVKFRGDWMIQVLKAVPHVSNTF
jgi:hypothetical protein